MSIRTITAFCPSKGLIQIRLTTVDGIGILVGDFDAEFLFEGKNISIQLKVGIIVITLYPYLLNGHNNLNGIQAVKSKVVCEVGGAVDLIDSIH